MSAAPSRLDTKPLPAHLHLDPYESLVAPGHDLTAQDAFRVEHTSDQLFGADSFPPHSHLATTLHFAAELDDFPYQHGLSPDQSSSLGPLSGGEHAPGLFADPEQQQQQQPMPSSGPGLEPPPAQSITVRMPVAAGTGSSPARSSMEGSDEDSPGGHPQGNRFGDPLSDEFGLSFEPGDGTDLGGKPREDKADSAPAWSELKTKAGKERKRLPLACTACRRKKVRCSGEKPACKHCTRGRVPCVYKHSTRKAAPRTDYMAMLDKRLKRMEERIIKAVPRNEQEGIASSVPRANVRPAIPGTASSGKGPKKRGADEAFAGPDLDSWAKTPKKQSLGNPADPNLLLSVHESEETRLLQEGLGALPSRDIQEHLADVFFDHVYGQAYHILHKPSFMRKLRAGALPPVLVLSVCAIAARFSNHPELTTKKRPEYLRGEEWASTARDIVNKRYDWSNITILICLLILGLHEFATCQGSRSWALGGQAIRMAFALQLHKDLDHDPARPNVPLSFVDREIRRRTMWACFLMDRFHSSGRDRPSFIKEEMLRIPLPVKEKNFQLDMPALTENLQGEVPGAAGAEDGAEASNAKENMGVAAYLIKAISIWGRIVSHMNQGGKDLDVKSLWDPDSEYTRLANEAEEMATSLPESLVYNSANLHVHDTESLANQFILLHIAIQQNILFLNRFATSPSSANTAEVPPTPFVINAGKKAYDAADRISEILKESESYFVTAPFVGYCAFLSSTVHVIGSYTSNPTIQANSRHNLGININFLSRMKRYWGMFSYMIDNLRDQFRNCAETSVRGNLPNGSSPSIASIFQYGDWFDRYPHGVSQSDFADPAIHKKKEEGEDAALEQKSELRTVEEYITEFPPSQSRDGSVRSKSISGKTKGPAGKRGSIHSRGRDGREHRGSRHQLDPVLTDSTAAAAAAAAAAQLAGLQQQQSPFMPGVTMAGASSASPGFRDLLANLPQSGAYAAALSPISPLNVGHGQFGGQQHYAHGLSAQDLLNSMQLAMPGGMARQSLLGIGTYNVGANIDASATAAMMEGLSEWNGAENSASGAREESHGSAGGAAGTSADGGHHNAPSQASIWGHNHDAGSASWFMDFEAPSVPDFSGLGGVDAYGTLFGTGNGAGRGGLNGGH